MKSCSQTSSQLIASEWIAEYSLLLNDVWLPNINDVSQSKDTKFQGNPQDERCLTRDWFTK
jgi:hypothetical protein